MNKQPLRPDILTRSGQYFDFTAPEKYFFEIEDIAHGLSKLCRFTGQCYRFYSVAQHSAILSRIVPAEHALAGLMHDCAEAFLGDVSRPLKALLPDYQVIEKRVEAALFGMLRIPYPLDPCIKTADAKMLRSEKATLMPPHDDKWDCDGEPMLGYPIVPMPPEAAFEFFMDRWRELAERGHGRK